MTKMKEILMISGVCILKKMDIKHSLPENGIYQICPANIYDITEQFDPVASYSDPKLGGVYRWDQRGAGYFSLFQEVIIRGVQVIQYMEDFGRRITLEWLQQKV